MNGGVANSAFTVAQKSEDNAHRTLKGELLGESKARSASSQAPRHFSSETSSWLFSRTFTDSEPERAYHLERRPDFRSLARASQTCLESHRSFSSSVTG